MRFASRKCTSSVALTIACLCAATEIDAFAGPHRADNRSIKLLSTTVLSVSKIPVRDDGSGLSYGERSRPFRRTFYTQPDWEKHRSTNRFIGNLANLLKSGVVRALLKELALITAVAIFVWAFNLLGPHGFDDLDDIHHNGSIPFLPVLVMPSQFFTFSSPALSLLLVFKTNTSYGRWDEARKAWGMIVNSSRTIMRQGAAWIHESDDISRAEKHRLMARLAAAVWCFPRSMTRHVLSAREDDAAYAADCRANLRPDLAEDLIAARHKPTRATYEISCAINEFPLSDIRRSAMDHSVTVLCDAMGANDRILSSPVPLVYTRHTARFLEVWLLLLPLGLWENFGSSWNHIGMIPFTVVLAFFLLGIEELGIQLEEPFSVLPLHKITNGIGLSAEEHVQWFLADDEKFTRSNLQTTTQSEYSGAFSNSTIPTWQYTANMYQRE